MDNLPSTLLEMPLILPHEKKAKRLSPETRTHITDLYCKGLTYQEIAREVGVAASTVAIYCTQNRKTLACRLLGRQVVKVIQECRAGALTISKNARTVQIQAPIQLIGDEAIRQALRGEMRFDDLLDAMDFILDTLNEPNIMEQVKILAIATAIRRNGTIGGAARELGLSARTVTYTRTHARKLGIPVDEYLSGKSRNCVPHMFRDDSGEEAFNDMVEDTDEQRCKGGQP